MNKEELKFDIEQPRATFVRECIFNKWVSGYGKIMEHLHNAVDTQDFIDKILGDPELATTSAYALHAKKRINK